jgi:hypothetical protein
MRAKIQGIGFVLGILLITLTASACKSPVPLLFERWQYPVDEYYIGTGIATDKNKGQALQTAKMRAISDLATQIQTTISSTRTASLSDDGIQQATSFEELIKETLHQEFENVMYIEYEQTTYAVIKRSDWEAQKVRKILREKEKAESILSARYPDMSPVLEIQILSKAISSLQATLWGTLVEGLFDDKAGFILPLIQARKDILSSRVLHSTLYYINEGVSASSKTRAREIADRAFKDAQLEKLCKEYEHLRVRLSANMTAVELESKAEEHIDFTIQQNSNLLEYLDEPEASGSDHKVYLVVRKSLWVNDSKRVDSLYQEVKSLEEKYQEDDSVMGKLQVLDSMRKLLDSSFLGLSVENMIFPYEQASVDSIPLRREQLIASVNLMLMLPKAVKEGESFTLRMEVRNSQALKTNIPIKCTLTDPKGHQILSEIVNLQPDKPFSYTYTPPEGDKNDSFQADCFWTQYPQRRAEACIEITKKTIKEKFMNWWNGLGSN